MNKYLLVGILVPLLFSGAAQDSHGIIDTPPEHELIYTPADIEWQDGPASFEPGARFAVLEGNPGEPGLFTLRIWMPDGFVIAPHWHPGVERVTILSGTFRMGHGETFDPDIAEPLGPGSHFSMPPEMTHFAI